MQQSIKTIGWIGTGVMGKSMCKHLLAAKYELNVFNRTAQKSEELVQLGAKFMQPKELAQSSDIVFLMLGYPHDVENMVFDQLINFMKPGSILVDHTTSSPNLAQKIYTELLKKNIHTIDAPVSGGDVGARDGKLTIMCGGDEETFNQVVPIFQKYGTNIQFMGKPGFGQHTKMGNQIVIANNMLGVVESLIYAYKSGLNVEHFLNTIKTGAAGSKALEILGPRMIKRDFAPGFYVEHFIKDMGIILDECNRMNLCLPGIAVVKQFYQSLVANGGAKDGTQALIKVLEKMNNVDISKKE